MRLRILIAAAVVSGGWLAACSKPAPEASGDARQIRLAEPPPSDSAVVSDLEAPNASKPALIRRPGAQALRPASPTTTPSHDHMADMAAPAPHVMSSMASSTLETPPVAGLSAAPEAPAVGFGGAIGHGLGAFEVPAPAPQSLSGGGNRGPMVLIRGGMGGIDDKCDIRGGHRGGTAVNRIAPAFGGYPRGGIR